MPRPVRYEPHFSSPLTPLPSSLEHPVILLSHVAVGHKMAEPSNSNEPSSNTSAPGEHSSGQSAANQLPPGRIAPTEPISTPAAPLATTQAVAVAQGPDPTGQPLQQAGNIAVDVNSAYSEDDASTYTASLTSSVLNFPTENGRRYHAFREGTYVFPNDAPEQDRMDMHHEMVLRACNGKLHMAPLDHTKGKRILDIGTGTGIWCIEMGDLYPDAEVIGNDFSPVQPSMVPKNVKFEVDDVEHPWTHQQKFGYVHTRFMAGSIADWPKLVERIYENLEPGGICEFQDGDFMMYSEDDSFKGTWVEKWNADFMGAAAKGGRTGQPGPELEGWVRAAGFEDVHHERLRLPVGIWPKDKRLKEVGAFNMLQLKEGLEGFSLRLFTGVLGWTPEEVQVLLSKVRKDLDNKDIHAQDDFHIVWARKQMA